MQFRLALRIKGINILPQGKFNFRFGLRDTSENAFPRVAARGNDTPQFTCADDVEGTAQTGKRSQYGEIGIRLHGEADPMIQGREGAVEFLKMVRQGVLRVDVQGCAEFFGEPGDGDAFTKQIFPGITEIVHWVSVKGQGLNSNSKRESPDRKTGRFGPEYTGYWPLRIFWRPA